MLLQAAGFAANRTGSYLVKAGGKEVEGGQNSAVRPQRVLLHDILVIYLHLHNNLCGKALSGDV